MGITERVEKDGGVL